MSVQVPLILLIDVEPDDRAPARRGDKSWPGIDRVFRYVRRLRPRLEEATGAPVHFSWSLRMDPQVRELHGDARWVARRYENEFARLSEAGDDIGLHPHAWRWDGRRDTWVNDLADPAWIEECVAVSFAAYRDAFARDCLSHRFGDRFIDDRTLAAAERCGAKYDLTLEPGMRGRRVRERVGIGRGRTPDHSSAPRYPYRPSRHDLLRPAQDGDAREIWMIPLTSTDTSDAYSWPRRVARRLRWPRRPTYRQISPAGASDPAMFWSWIERDLRKGTRLLAFAIRSDVPLRPQYLGAVREKLDLLLAGPMARRFRFTTPAEALELAGLAGPNPAVPGRSPPDQR